MKIYDEIPYYNPDAPQPEPELVPFLLKGKNNPCVIVLPGGGYEGLTPHEGNCFAEYFNSIGVSAFVLNYRIKPHMYPVQLLDVQRTIRLVRHNADEFGVNPDMILCCGSSAGGHLAACAACYGDDGLDSGDDIDRESSKICGMILCYAVLTMQGELTNAGTSENLCGGDEQIADKMSVERHIHAGMPPLFCWSTFDDGMVDIRNTLMLCTEYKKYNLDCECHIYRSGWHGGGLSRHSKSMMQWTDQLRRWMAEEKFIPDFD